MFQGLVKESLAFRLMVQMGWEEGDGLGKNKQGMREHLRVRNKQDVYGLGLDQKMKSQENWSLNTKLYDNILKDMKVVAVQAAKGHCETEDDTDSDAEDEQEKVVKVLKVTRPQGRYKKRENGKMVRTYSKTELAAILGSASEEVTTQSTSQAQQSDIISSHEQRSHRSKEPSPENVEKEPSPRIDEDNSARVVHDYCVKGSPERQHLAELPEDWWGCKFGFVRAGSLGSTSEAQRTERTAFREQDQENLYTLVSGKATTGKQGLGIADRKLRKIAGVEWKGQKKALRLESDGEDEVDEGNANSNEGNNSSDATNRGNGNRIGGTDPGTAAVTKPQRLSKACDGKVSSDVENVAATESISKIVGGNLRSSSGWKRVCTDILAEAPSQTLSLKRLLKKALGGTLLSHGAPQPDRMASLKRKLQKSSRFVVEGKKVSLQ